VADTDLAQLYPAFFERLCAYCAAMSKDRAGGEDLAQEAFMRALKDAEFSDLEDAQQRAWLYRAARNLFYDAMRRQKRIADEDPPERPFLDDLTAIEVRQTLAALHPDAQRLVALRCFSGFSSAQIARMLNIPAATVRTRLRAALRRLRSAYKEEETT